MNKLIIIFLFMFSCTPTVERFGGETNNKKEPTIEVVEESDAVSEGVNDWMLIRAFQGEWKITSGDHTYDDHCLFEFHYSKSREKFELRTDGYLPKNHDLYPKMSKVMGKVNKSKLDGHTDMEIIDYIQKIVTK